MKIRPSDTTKWYQDKGDETLRLDYDLNENSIIIDLGSHNADWSAPMIEKYNCHAYLFEPWVGMNHSIMRLMNYPKVNFYNYAASTYDGKITMGIEDQEPSVFHEENQISFDCIDFKKFLRNKNFEKVDVLKINIEGGEYELLEDLLDNGFIDLFDNIQVQFHMIENYEERYKSLSKKLSKTHNKTWHYPFVWENWKKNI